MSLLDTAFMQRSLSALPLSELIDMFEAWIKRWHGLYDERLRCFVGPGGAQWCSADLLHAAADLAHRYETGLHMHLLETRIQDIGARQHFGMSAVQWLAQEGILGPHMSLPHSVWIYDEADLHALAASGACVVHNPAANLKLGSGLAPIRRMRDLGIPVALGCDGAASSDNQVIFEAMRLAALVHTLSDHDPTRWLQAQEVVDMATLGGAAALVLPGQVGALQPGYLADITLLDRRSPHLLPLNNMYRHLAFCETGRSVHTVIVNGEVVVEAGRIVAFDADSILNEIHETMHQRRWQQPFAPEVQQAMELFSRWRQAVLDMYGVHSGNGK
jgi:cytosine/adenosine deaminase-related metal-dependent hydrolase